MIVHQYLGKPKRSNKKFSEEQWLETRENGEYVLTVFYDKDSVANNYNLVFNYHLSFFHKRYDIKEAAENRGKNEN